MRTFFRWLVWARSSKFEAEEKKSTISFRESVKKRFVKGNLLLKVIEDECLSREQSQSKILLADKIVELH